MKKTKSAGGIIINNKGQIVLISHGSSILNLPKGHIKKNETIEEAAKREVYEETGIKDAKLVKFLGEYTRYTIAEDGVSEDKSELKTIYIYLFSSNKKKLKPLDPKNPFAKWVNKEKIFDYLKHPKDIEFIKKIMDKI